MKHRIIFGSLLSPSFQPSSFCGDFGQFVVVRSASYHIMSMYSRLRLVKLTDPVLLNQLYIYIYIYKHIHHTCKVRVCKCTCNMYVILAPILSEKAHTYITITHGLAAQKLVASWACWPRRSYHSYFLSYKRDG